MGLKKISEKLDSYLGRLEDGRAAKIERSHVEKVIDKLKAKQTLLQEEVRDTEKPSKIERLKSKLSTVGEQIERAEWLLEKIGPEPSN